jgi:hypothetical protein
MAGTQPEWWVSNCKARADRGIGIFVDELERFAAAVSDPRCAAVAGRVGIPLRAAVSGRRGVGRSTVARALARAGVRVTTVADADVDVVVVADAVKPEDRAAIAATGRPVLAVLNKADLVSTTAAGRHRNGPTAAARARCAQLSSRAGASVEPMIGLLAVAALDDRHWAELQAVAAGQTASSRRLMATLDAFGVRQATAAIRRGAARADVEALLRALSGIDSVVAKIDALGAQLRYRRVLAAVAELETMAVTDRRIGEFLAHDDTVVARMRAAVDAVESAGLEVDRGDTADAHLRRATHWQRRRRGSASGVERACGADIVRGSLRLWSKAGGAV